MLSLVEGNTTNKKAQVFARNHPWDLPGLDRLSCSKIFGFVWMVAARRIWQSSSRGEPMVDSGLPLFSDFS